MNVRVAAWISTAILIGTIAHGQSAQAGSQITRKPLVIAHRGASGYLPEHTIQGYRLAMEMGADFVEPDLVSTKDGVLIARHEPNMIDTTDVKTHPEFAKRKVTKVVDGNSQEGFFAEDFTLAEIKTLRAVQSRAFRDQSFNGKFEIPTLVEVIASVKAYETETGRKVGIYPETKHPTYFRELGLPLEEKLVDTLISQNFTAHDRVFIQSFEVSNLKDILSPLLKQHDLNIPLVQLMDEFTAQPYDYIKAGRKETYGDLATRDSLKNLVATYAAGIGPWKASFFLREPLAEMADLNGDGVAETSEKLTGQSLPLLDDAHAAGLLVHPYTFRNEEQFLAVGYKNAVDEFEQVFAAGVDGVFTDFADTGVRARSYFQLLNTK